MSCSDLNFLAEREQIQIVPNFNQHELYLISGNVGPFEAGISVKVPLWLAIYLKHRHKCKIIQPDWMTVDCLEELKKEEQSKDVFAEVPSPHFMEIVHSLILNAPDDVVRGDDIKTLIKDIWDTRMAKLRRSISIFIGEERPHAVVNNLTPFEICQVRQFLTMSLDHLDSLQTALQNIGIHDSLFSQ